jgi:signal transduction histidine kinase
MKGPYIGLPGLLFLLSVTVFSQTIPEAFIKKYDSASSSEDKGRSLIDYYEDRLGSGKTSTALLNYFKDQDDHIGEDYARLFIILYQTGVTGEFTASLKEAFEILSSFEKRKDKYGQMWAHAAVASSFATAKNYDSAMVYYKRELALTVTLNDENRNLNVINDIGFTYYLKRQPDSGIVYAKQAINICRQNNDTYFLIYALSTLGENYLVKQSYDAALLAFRECWQYISQYGSGDTLALAGIFNDFAECFMGMNNKDSGIYYAKLVINIASRNNLKIDLLRCYENLYRFFDKLNMVDSSSKYFRLATIAKDSLYNVEKMKLVQQISFDEQLRKQEEAQQRIKLQNQIKFYSLLAGIAFFLIMAVFLYRNNVQKKKANTLLQQQKEEIEKQRDKADQAMLELKSAQAQLIQSEKMASLGELTAGIAHEIQNPLNFVNNFSEVNDELLKELKTEAENGNLEEVKAIAKDIAFNSEKINHHGKRADSIVKGMLQHSRSSSGVKEPTDINALTDEYLRLAYHGLRAKDKTFSATTKTEFDNTIGKINVNPQDIGRVILNLINNAFYAVSEKAKQNLNGYEPTVTVSTLKNNGKIEIKVKDNGDGIPQKVLDKIFQPFFTTKPTGQGTGLGLSLSYDIVKAHGGELKVETKEGEGSEFVIQLPATNVI